MQHLPKCILYELANIISKSRFLNHKRVNEKECECHDIKNNGARVYTKSSSWSTCCRQGWIGIACCIPTGRTEILGGKQ